MSAEDMVVCVGTDDDPLPSMTDEQWTRVVQARKECGHVLDAAEVREIISGPNPAPQ